MQIEDGIGKGYKATVDSENRLLTLSVTKTLERHINEDEGNSYNLLFSQAPTANDDCILYMLNSSVDKMVVEGMWLYVSGACEVYYAFADTGTRNGAVTLTPVNLNSASGSVAEGTFERGADLDGGAATVTIGNPLNLFKFTAETATSIFNFEQDLIITKNNAMVVLCDTAGVTVTGTVIFNYHP